MKIQLAVALVVLGFLYVTTFYLMLFCSCKSCEEVLKRPATTKDIGKSSIDDCIGEYKLLNIRFSLGFISEIISRV